MDITDKIKFSNDVVKIDISEELFFTIGETRYVLLKIKNRYRCDDFCDIINCGSFKGCILTQLKELGYFNDYENIDNIRAIKINKNKLK
jgi:ribosomal protein S8